MYLDGRRLHYFLTVADLGSLGRAAEVLHVAQPALSRQIRLLEEDVGVPLMARNTRGMTLTAAGRAYYPVPAGCWMKPAPLRCGHNWRRAAMWAT